MKLLTGVLRAPHISHFLSPITILLRYPLLRYWRWDVTIHIDGLNVNGRQTTIWPMEPILLQRNLSHLRPNSTYLFRLRRYHYMLYYDFHVSDSLFRVHVYGRWCCDFEIQGGVHQYRRFLFTLVSTGFRFGERFGRNITVNQCNWFSMNCLVFLLTWNVALSVTRMDRFILFFLI